MARATVRLFVYGSLRRGGRHHDELTAAGARFLGEAETMPGYRLEALKGTEYVALVSCSGISPGAGVTDGAGVVSGELFEVPASQLPALDAFEGDAYSRGVVRLRPHNQTTPNAAAESLAYFKKAR